MRKHAKDFALYYLLLFEICTHEISVMFINKYSEIREYVNN